MSANGISTHYPKSERRMLKLRIAETERKAGGNVQSPSYRVLNVLTIPLATSPAVGHPWSK